MKLRSLVSALAIVTVTSTLCAQERKLSVGDNAPGLDIDKWVKPEGKEVTIQPGKVYVVEFWATWCGPCKVSIPHLSEIQAKYGEDQLTIIGISTDDEKTRKNVVPFVRAQGDRMGYTVAIDKNGGTQRAWAAAAGAKGIPFAVIVDRKGKVAWFGNPHPQANEGFEETLKQVMAGRFDPKLQKQAAPVLQAARSARKVRNWLLASKHYDDIVKMDQGVFASVALEKFEMLLVDMDDRAKAYDYARNALMGQAFANDAGALQMLAEKIATDPKIDQPKRDMDLALEAVEAARRLSQDDPQSLAAVALIRYHRGEIEQAIDLQKQAYFTASPRLKPDYKRTLTTYQEAAQRAAAAVTKPS